LNAETDPTVCYIFFHFIIGYEKNPAELQLLKKNMVVIVFRNQNRQIEIQPNQHKAWTLKCVLAALHVNCMILFDKVI
jgi:hypothetical protein